MIIGLIFILITAPIWISISFVYLFAMGLVYLALFGFDIILSIIKIFNDGYEFSDFLSSIIINFIDSFYKWIVRFDDIFDYFWEFGRYDYPGWAIAISIFLFIIYTDTSRRG